MSYLASSYMIQPSTVSPGTNGTQQVQCTVNPQGKRLTAFAKLLLTKSYLGQVVVSQVPATATTGPFEKLFENEAFQDAVIKVGDKTIKVNRAVLASRSPVFYGMFLNKQTEVTIEDVDYETLKVLVEYIYRDRVQDTSKLTLEVRIAAGKYNISGLKALVENHLISNLSKANIEQTLTAAKKHKLINFLNRCITTASANGVIVEMVTRLLDKNVDRAVMADSV